MDDEDVVSETLLKEGTGSSVQFLSKVQSQKARRKCCLLITLAVFCVILLMLVACGGGFVLGWRLFRTTPGSTNFASDWGDKVNQGGKEYSIGQWMSDNIKAENIKENLR